ncbi:MAG: helix-turn-helix domain-containing protein [Chryseolinea sp.]
MASNIITPEDLAVFKRELIDEIRKLLSERQQPQTQRWLKSHQVMRVLTVSPGTLQHMRVTGVLPFTKIGGVIYYDALDIEKMIVNNKQNAK